MKAEEIKRRLYYELSEVNYRINIVESKLTNVNRVKEWSELVSELSYLQGIREGILTACKSLLGIYE